MSGSRIWIGKFVRDVVNVANTGELRDFIVQLVFRRNAEQQDRVIRAFRAQAANDGSPILFGPVLRVRHTLARAPTHRALVACLDEDQLAPGESAFREPRLQRVSHGGANLECRRARYVNCAGTAAIAVRAAFVARTESTDRRSARRRSTGMRSLRTRARQECRPVRSTSRPTVPGSQNHAGPGPRERSHLATARCRGLSQNGVLRLFSR